MITLASDFGTPYPAAMRGVILDRCDARVVDVAHDLPRQDVRASAFWLRETLPWFPPAVHCAVVDPGVGTDRAALVVRVGDHALVGPDNGLLLPPAREIAERTDATVETFDWHVDDPASSTFHGRDVFAPAAAAVHEAGVDAIGTLDAATPTDEFVDLRFPDPEIAASATSATGEVLVVDGFGNVVTNLPGDLLAGRERVHVGPVDASGGAVYPVTPAYAHTEAGEPLVTVGSHGNVELAVNRGRGDELFGLAVGDGVRVTVER
ncbi:SAM hydrolase/SAM-dependent halogenase family protein [Halomarina oriensis]|uniref:S-adenosyl-l-methionine hydroxide adenosyltransferase n=1 Tax=Halomarina oriensis TaxID=671145 RepID=A0A6B0GNC6_9EURY|nr:SAM-dependent chlorinase/fluorinase [Halomarina oriensis]MWG35451.1 S-adenosyl-l-methionine hydroxide adenosyltransferase [Halomarina oriensis]